MSKIKGTYILKITVFDDLGVKCQGMKQGNIKPLEIIGALDLFKAEKIKAVESVIETQKTDG